MEKMLTSRTAALCYKTCPFKRFLAFHYNGLGLSPNEQDINLLLGSAVHRGLQHLLEHCRIEHPDGNFEEKCIDEAVFQGVNCWREALVDSALSLKSGEELNLAFIIAEHECEIEGLVRSFAIYRLPSLLEEYEILEVEKEDIFEDFSSIVTWQARADGLFRRKVDNKLVILSIKTASEYADVTLRNILHDMQGCSEWYAAQDKIDKEWNMFCGICSLPVEKEDQRNKEKVSFEKRNGKTIIRYFDYCFENDIEPKIYAVQYEHLITGLYRDFTKSGLRTRQSFLIHPQKLEIMGGYNIFTGEQSFNPDEYKWKIPKGRSPKGWNKINIWEDIGVKLWIDILTRGEIQPEEGNPLAEVIRTSELVIRTDEELEEWRISTQFQEEQIANNLIQLNHLAEKAKQIGDWKLYNIVLQQLFPKNTQSCHDYYGRDCQFVPICHYGQSLEDSSEFYQIRVPHHDLEKQRYEETIK